MPLTRVWMGLVVLAVVSLVGDRICRSVTSGSNQEQMLRVASEAVGQLPESFGPWRTLESDVLSDNVLGMLQCRAHQSRVYVDDETGDKVSLILLVGAAGPMVAHTPEICYGSSAFDIVEKAQAEVVRGTGERADTFDRVLFRSKGLSGQKQQVYYGWRPPAGHWQAPKNPRLTLAGSPLLYKIQLATTDVANMADSGVANAANADVANAADSSDDAKPAASPDRRFLADLLPVLDSLLQNR